MKTMQHSNRMGSIAATWLVLFLSLIISDIAWARNECFPVQGTFKSQTLPPDECTSPVAFCTRGILTGGLWGDYEFVAQQFISANERTVPLANFYSGFSYVSTRRGELQLTDTGALDLAAGRISALLTATGGAGDFEHATGYLYVYGASDSETNTNIGRYRGEICMPGN